MNKTRENMNIKTSNSNGFKSLDEILEIINSEKIEYYSITDYEDIESSKYLDELKLDGYIKGIEFRPYLENDGNNFRVSILGYNYNINKMEKNDKNKRK